MQSPRSQYQPRLMSNLTIAELRASLRLAPRSDLRLHWLASAEPESPPADPPRRPSPPLLNRTVCQLRASVGLEVPAGPADPADRQVRSKFAESNPGPPPDLFGQYSSVFAMSGRAGGGRAAEHRLVHQLCAEPNFELKPQLGRVARRKLRQGQLDKLDAALAELEQPGSGGLESFKPVWWLVADVRDSLLDVVLVKGGYSQGGAPDLTERVIEAFNPTLVTQMISHGAYGTDQFRAALESVGETIKEAAPLCSRTYQRWFGPVREQMECGRISAVEDFPWLAMELVETLEDVKLELANLRLTLLRPAIVEAGLRWERAVVAESVADGSMGLAQAIPAVQAAVARLERAGEPVGCLEIHTDLTIHLLTQKSTVPDLFWLDAERITRIRDKTSRMSLLCALWPLGMGILKQSGVELHAHKQREIRATILIDQVPTGWLQNDHKCWAIEFFHWLHACAAEQNRQLPPRLANQLVVAADPASPMRTLMTARIAKVLREAFLGQPGMDETERKRVWNSLEPVAAELSGVVRQSTQMAAHSFALHRPLYLPFCTGMESKSPPTQAKSEEKAEMCAPERPNLSWVHNG